MKIFKKLSIFIFLVMTTVALFACSKKNITTTEKIEGNITSGNVNEAEDNNTLFQNLRVLESGFKLSEESKTSLIKQEYLIMNNGYKDDDEVVIIVQADKEGLIDAYNKEENLNGMSVSDFAKTNTGASIYNEIQIKQDKMVEELNELGYIIEQVGTYKTLFNGIAIKTLYKNVKNIESLSTVKGVVLSETYNIAGSGTSEGAQVENPVEVYDTGIFDSSSVTYTGIGTVTAILDSGFELSHDVFKRQPEGPLFDKEYIASILPDSLAAGFTEGLEASNVYYSSKIPFAYDYADKDYDVFPYDSEHGTHVAGIIGGKSDVITGVAINTQLVLLKVFSNFKQGAESEDILAALEDAVLLGVDAINMSLGSDCGFVREVDEVEINRVYDKINEAGISLITAASNSYSSSHGGAQGNTNMVTNPDSGTVGSPSTYIPSFSVASISGVKSHYFKANDKDIIFFNESSMINGDKNDFFKELYASLGKDTTESITLEYVTVPGVGLKVNFSSLGSLEGKIALIKRGDNTFEEKAANAKAAGATACIIYNNIDGDILMSMGKTDHIPTVSISKDDGTKMAEFDFGTLNISYSNAAGPFMSDFSSWGPTPSLEIKPEITAHGGDILSSVLGNEYEELSGTSMASPNMAGIVVLFKQYLKEKFPGLSLKEYTALANEFLMSTSTIVLNQEAIPYSVRKQGSGLASIYNAVNTRAYCTVDGKNKTKIELFDDPERIGIYDLDFNIVNISDAPIAYNLDVLALTETVSTSDENHVREMDQYLTGSYEAKVIENGTLVGNKITVEAGKTAKVTIKYTLSDADKEMIDRLFSFGMYVEGFVKLSPVEEGDIELSIPFLGFYGDWSEAPILDKTLYEVETEAHDKSIDEEDKIKADYYASVPLGSYYYNYIIPLGQYLYKMDESMYDPIPASIEHMAISNYLGTIDGIWYMCAGLLRNAKEVDITVTNKVTGEVVWEKITYNARKAHGGGGSPRGSYIELEMSTLEEQFYNNTEYTFTMMCYLDYENNGEFTNVRNKFEFDFTVDTEAPVLTNAVFEKTYDKTLKKDRYYINLDVYDNHYAMSAVPINWVEERKVTHLLEYPVPIYSEKNSTTKVRFEITDIIDNLKFDTRYPTSFAVELVDYALNESVYLIELPGTNGDFIFTEDGTDATPEIVNMTAKVGEVIDLTKYIYTSDVVSKADMDYFRYLSWSTSDETIGKANDGFFVGLKPGKVTITVTEALHERETSILIDVVEDEVQNTSSKLASNLTTMSLSSQANEKAEDAKINDIRFTYFETVYAYPAGASYSKIGEIGDKFLVNTLTDFSFYPGEKIQLYYDFDPWYAESNYNLTWSSTNPKVASVDENGLVTGLKKGTTTIKLTVGGSTLIATLRITIESEFIIESRELIAYKGLGGDVVIPDDEGILYIGAYAFCLYETDRDIKNDEDDYDRNKIPKANATITSITIPKGVMDIKKYAFYNCTALTEVIVPESCDYIRDKAFYGDTNLVRVDLSNTKGLGSQCFEGCTSLSDIDLSKIQAVGENCFKGCTSLTEVNLTSVRSAGPAAFADCSKLIGVEMNEFTKLSQRMFSNSGIRNIVIYEKREVPQNCFEKCGNLLSVEFVNDCIQIASNAFVDCKKLTTVKFDGAIDEIKEGAFLSCIQLSKVTLPSSDVKLGLSAFGGCSSLSEVIFQENTKLVDTVGAAFEGTKVSKFTVNANNPYYKTNGNYLMNKAGNEIIFGLATAKYGELVIPQTIDKIDSGAFTGCQMTKVTFENPNIVIGDYAFADIQSLISVVLPANGNVTVGKFAFANDMSLLGVTNLESVKLAKEYAFNRTGLTNAIIGENSVYEEGAFFRTNLKTVTIGKNANLGLGLFEYNSSLTTVNMPAEGGVHFSSMIFAFCNNLVSIDLSKTDSVIEDRAFFACTKLKAANLTNVKEVGEYCFANCVSLTDVTMPVMERIGDYAFSLTDLEGYSAAPIKNLTLPNTLKVLGEGAFLGNSAVETLTIPSSVEEVGLGAFERCLALKTVVLPTELKTIPQFAFALDEALTTINLESVEIIDEYAFYSCPSLKTVNLNSATAVCNFAFVQSGISGDINAPVLDEIGEYAFSQCEIEHFNAPNLRIINDNGFYELKSLKDFTFSPKLEKIGIMVFTGCESLESFYSVNAKGETIETGKINDYCFLLDKVLYVVLPNGHYELKAVPSALEIETLNVLEDTYRVDFYAGNENKFISKIVFPDSLKILGPFAFYGYESLETVEFRTSVAPLLEDFYNPNYDAEEGDPGYTIVHKYVELNKFPFAYTQFVDVVGKNEPLTMILPKNSVLEGYDTPFFKAFFGTVSEAQRSEYEAMEKAMVKFIEDAKKILEIKVVTLSNEALINEAVTLLNQIKQDPTNYGISADTWNEYVEKATDAKKQLVALKLHAASSTVKSVQATIDAFPQVFDIEFLDDLYLVTNKIQNLTSSEKSVLDQANLQNFITLYNNYLKDVQAEAEKVQTTLDSGALIIVTAISAMSLLAGAFFALKRRFF